MKTHPYTFGYHWIWTYGHLIPTGFFGLTAVAAAAHNAPTWLKAILAATALWAFAGFIVSRFVIRMNDPSELPTQDFLASGRGTVLDLGVGAGRTSIMVGLARPNAKLVCVDNFSADYIEGHGANNTTANFAKAGIADRARIESADMRKMPFSPETFDAATSCAAIDHLQPNEIIGVVADINKVLKPNGELLLMVIVPNIYSAIAYGPLVHMHMAPRKFWRDTLSRAGFKIESEGTSRGIAWFHTRKQRALAAGEIEQLEGIPVRTGAHAFNLHELAIPAAISGAVFIAAALLLRLLGYTVSWWWIAAAIPIGMHAGILLVSLAALLGVFRHRHRHSSSSPSRDASS